MARWLVPIAVLLVLAPRVAEPCSISGAPAAHVFQPTSGIAPGRQPWIRLWKVKGAVKLTSVAAGCAAKKRCAGKAIAFDRTGSYVRPRAPLADGTRFQITANKTLLADLTVTSAKPVDLTAWTGIRVGAATIAPEGLCSPPGPRVELVFDPTSVELSDLAVLVYLTAPDPKQPHVGLAHIYSLGGGQTSIALHNELGDTPWLAQVPKQLWIAVADSDGHVGAPRKLDVAPAPSP